MVATPKTGTLTFRGDQSGRVYNYSIYDSDVAGAFVTWSLNGTAGSSSVNFISAPENMTLIDVSVVTGIVDTTAILLYLDDAAIPGTLTQWANVVNTLQKRSFPPLKIRGGRKVQFIEVA